MNYYFIDQYERQNDDYCFISDPPQEISLLSSYIMDGTPAITKYPTVVQALMSDERGGRMLTDFIGNGELCLIVSLAAKTVMEQINRGPVEYLPLSILNHKGRLASADYFYVNPLGAYDCLDYAHSEIEYFEDTQKVVDVDRYVLCPKKLEQVPDLFRIKEEPTGCYVISQTLLDALQAAQLTNLVVVPIEQVAVSSIAQ